MGIIVGFVIEVGGIDMNITPIGTPSVKNIELYSKFCYTIKGISSWRDNIDMREDAYTCVAIEYDHIKPLSFSSPVSYCGTFISSYPKEYERPDHVGFVIFRQPFNARRFGSCVCNGGIKYGITNTGNVYYYHPNLPFLAEY